MKQTTKAHLALIATNIFFAINYTAVKTLFNGNFVKPFGLNIIRVGVTSALLWILYIFAPTKTKVKKEKRRARRLEEIKLKDLNEYEDE